jgi:very-short-patch-repair endonuclease
MFLSTHYSDKYYVFPQIHLSEILDNKIVGQNWKMALRHINQKSIDFLLVRKTDLRPLLGIELDDWSHDSEERKLRDVNVETIFKEAGFPLVRLRNIHHLSENELLLNINSKLIQ